MKGLFSSKKTLGILLAVLAVLVLFIVIWVKVGAGKAFGFLFLAAVIGGLIFALKKYGSDPKWKKIIIAAIVVTALIVLSMLFGAARIFGSVFLLIVIAAIAIAIILMWHKGWLTKTVRIVLTVIGILLIVLLIVSLFGNLFKGAGKGGAGVLNGNTSSVATIDNSADQVDNGIAITVYGNESDAKGHPYSSDLVGYSLLAIVDDSEAAKVSAIGTRSGATGSAASDNWFGNMTTGSTPAVAYDSTNAGREWFILDSNQFEDGEVVLVTIETSVKNGFMSKKFAQQTDNASVYYWAFTARHGNNTGTAPEESAAGTNTAAPDQNNSYVAGNSGSTVVNQNNGNGTVGYVVIGNQPYATYATFEEAWDNASPIASTTIEVTCIPFGTTESIDVIALEAPTYPSLAILYLKDTSTWSGTMDLNGVAGETVVLKLIYADGKVLASHDTQFVGITVPAN